MKVMYEAYDGVIFRTEKECLDYEKRLDKINNVKGLYFFDENGNLIEGTFEEKVEKAFYIYIHSKEILNDLLKFNEEEAFYYDLPSNEGFWYFNSQNNNWIDFEKKVERAHEIIKKYGDMYFIIDKSFLYKD